MHSVLKGRAGMTLVETIGAVVIAGILLAIALPSIAEAVRVRNAEAVLKHDLGHAATVFEQAYLSSGDYSAAPALRLSPNIAVDSQAVAGERIFLRLRHVPTGQLCLLDYSRSSAVARNRPDCYGGGQPRDTALTLTPERPAVPGADTFRVPPPTPPDSAPNELALASPAVSSPGAQTGRPGSQLSQTFLVTNRSPVSRSFRFEVGSSRPEVVATPISPQPRELAPGDPTPVVVAYAVAQGALADGSAVLALRAVDEGDARWNGTGSFTFSTDLVLAPPRVSTHEPVQRIEPAGEEFTGEWTVTNQANAPRILVLDVVPGEPVHVQPVSTVGTGRVPFAPGESRRVTARLRVSGSSDGGTASDVVLNAVDAEAPAYHGSASLRAETATLLAAPVITSPGGAQADPGGEVTLRWRVRNAANSGRRVTVAVRSADAGHLQVVSSTGTGTFLLGRGQETEVTATVRVAGSSLAGESSDVLIEAVDQAAPTHRANDGVRVTTNLVLAAPAITPPAPTTRKPGEEFTVVWTVRNQANSTRALRIEPSPAADDVTLVSASGAGEQSFRAHEVRTFSAKYRMADRSLAGAGSRVGLQAADQLSPGLSSHAFFEVTTAADYRDPVLTGPADRSVVPGTRVLSDFQLTNRSNTTRTFRLEVTSTDPALLNVEDAGQVTVPAFGTADVRVQASTDESALGYSRAVLALGAVDGTRQGSAQHTLTILAVYRTPVLTAAAPQTAKPGTARSDSVMLYNRSNVAAEFCFSAAIAAGNVSAGRVVAPDPSVPACRVVGARGTADGAVVVPVGYAIAADADAGWTNTVELTASQGTTGLAATSQLVVAAELALESPAWVALPPSPMFWDVGEQRELRYTLRNRSNAPRTFCVQVAPADPARLAPVSPESQCGVRVGPRDTATVRHTIRAAGPGSGQRVVAVVHDEESVSLRAAGEFVSEIRETRPTAVWSAPHPVYVRKWATFDGTASWSPVGAPIARYVWTWGLLMHQWDPAQGRFVYTGVWETAKDELSTGVVQRAYDLQGAFTVCLTVVDAMERASEPNCQVIAPVRGTVARLAWRYRGWWTDQDWCADVWWDNQCDPEHGNARWEIDLRPSIGDVPVKQAYASIRVKLHNTDDPNRPATVTYTGNSGTTPAWGSYSFGGNFPNAVGKAQDGRWRVLSTSGTTAFGWPGQPNLGDHPLVLNVNLAAATGIFDGGPHWVPDEVWLTLHVQDAHDMWTSVSAYRNHDKGAWRAGYDTTVVAEASPTASVTVQGSGDGNYTAIGVGDSPGGRIVKTWWEITSEDAWGEGSTWTAQGTSVVLAPFPCERITAVFVVVDDLGRTGRAGESVSGGGQNCSVTDPERPR